MMFPLFSELPYFQLVLPTSLGIISALSSSSCPVGVSLIRLFQLFQRILRKPHQTWDVFQGNEAAPAGGIHGKLSLGTAHSLGKRGFGTPELPEPKAPSLDFGWEKSQEDLGMGSAFRSRLLVFCHGFFLRSCISSASFPAKAGRRECLPSEVSGKLPPAGIRPCRCPRIQGLYPFGGTSPARSIPGSSPPFSRRSFRDNNGRIQVLFRRALPISTLAFTRFHRDAPEAATDNPERWAGSRER